MTTNHIKTHLLFPTPVLEFEVEGADALNSLLRDEIAQRTKAEEGNNRSNVSGWHSKSDFFARSEPGHRELAQAILTAVQNGTARIAGKKRVKDLRFRLEGWVNVNPATAYNMPHDHPGAFWSGAYYVTMPPASEAHPEHGSISFIDNRAAPAGQPAIQSPFFRGNINFRPKEGTIMLFPGTVRHWVHPQFDSPSDRISIAFNAVVIGQAPQRPQLDTTQDQAPLTEN